MIESKKTEKVSDFVRVAECLYRYTPKNTYYAWIKISGKKIKKSLRTQDRKLAERRLKDFRSKAERIDLDSESRRILFEELGKNWLQLHNSSLKPSSAQRNERCVRELNRFFKGSRVSDLKRTDCQNWEVKRGKNLSSSTFNKDLEVLRALLDYAVERGVMLDNPASGLKRRKIQSKAVIIPTHGEFDELLAGIRKLDGRANEALNLVQLLAYSGMRLGEAVNIVWNEVDFAKGCFTVSGGEVGTKNRQIRVVPLFPKLRKFLEILCAEKEARPRSKIIAIQSAKKAIITSCKNGGLPHFTHHCMRHYFVSNAIEKNIDFKTIAAWVGHSDGGMLVAKTYGHLRDTHSYEMAQLMN
jgi:integrase